MDRACSIIPRGFSIFALTIENLSPADYAEKSMTDVNKAYLTKYDRGLGAKDLFAIFLSKKKKTLNK